MIHVIKQVGKDLYFRCAPGGCEWVSFGDASITRRYVTVNATMERLRTAENPEKIEFEIVSFSDKDLSKFIVSTQARR